MGKKSYSRSKKAPLASFESLMSIESLAVDQNTRKWGLGDDSDNTDNFVRRNDNNDNNVMAQPWTRPHFANMTTRRQNYEIFKVNCITHIYMVITN